MNQHQDSKNHLLLFSTKPTDLKTNWPPIYGHIYDSVPPMRLVKKRENETYTDYMVCPSYFYNKTNYPDFPSGCGYLFPWWSVPCLYAESLKTPFFFLEDVFMGGFVAERCLVPRRNMNGFNPMRKDPQSVNPNWDLLMHYMNHNNKFDIHKKLTAA